jgi:hypothetical protein
MTTDFTVLPYQPDLPVDVAMTCPHNGEHAAHYWEWESDPPNVATYTGRCKGLGARVTALPIGKHQAH